MVCVGRALADPLAGPPIEYWRLVGHCQTGKCGSQPVWDVLIYTMEMLVGTATPMSMSLPDVPTCRLEELSVGDHC